MIDEELTKFHDGELPEEEARRVRASIAGNGRRRAELELIERIDLAVAELDRIDMPSPDQIERGKDALKAKLRSGTPSRHSRRILAVVAALTSAAAVVAIMWGISLQPIIGSVQYEALRTLDTGEYRSEVLRLRSTVAVNADMAARIRVDETAEIRLGTGSGLNVGDRPDEIRVLKGELAVKSISEFTIIAADSGWSIRMEPDSEMRISLTSDRLTLKQVRGRSKVLDEAGGERSVVAPAVLQLELGKARTNTD